MHNYYTPTPRVTTLYIVSKTRNKCKDTVMKVRGGGPQARGMLWIKAIATGVGWHAPEKYC